MPPSFSRHDTSLENWRIHPFCRWTFQNVSEFVPVAEFGARHTETPPPENRGMERLELAGRDGGAVQVTDFLANTHADAFVAMRDGNVLAEWYAPHCRPDQPHLVFSISKSITGLLAGIAVGDGVLDAAAPISRYATVAECSAYASANVRDLLDMKISIDFEEDYLNLDGAFDRYRRAMLWNPERSDTTPETLAEVLATLPRGSEPHGKRFFYVSPNTDLMGLVLEGATGQRFHDYLRDRLWLPMGGRGAAYVTVDRLGTARAAGGICITARDLARLGQLLLDGGVHDGHQVVPAAWIEDL